MNQRSALKIDTLFGSDFFKTPENDVKQINVSFPIPQPLEKLEDFFSSERGQQFDEGFRELIRELENWAKSKIPSSTSLLTQFEEKYVNNATKLSSPNRVLFTTGIEKLANILKLLENNEIPEDYKIVCITHLLSRLYVCGPAIAAELITAYDDLYGKLNFGVKLQSIRLRLVTDYCSTIALPLLLQLGMGGGLPHHIFLPILDHAENININPLNEDQYQPSIEDDIVLTIWEQLDKNLPQLISPHAITEALLQELLLSDLPSELAEANEKQNWVLYFEHRMKLYGENRTEKDITYNFTGVDDLFNYDNTEYDVPDENSYTFKWSYQYQLYLSIYFRLWENNYFREPEFQIQHNNNDRVIHIVEGQSLKQSFVYVHKKKDAPARSCAFIPFVIEEIINAANDPEKSLSRLAEIITTLNIEQINELLEGAHAYLISTEYRKLSKELQILYGKHIGGFLRDVTQELNQGLNPITTLDKLPGVAGYSYLSNHPSPNLNFIVTQPRNYEELYALIRSKPTEWETFDRFLPNISNGIRLLDTINQYISSLDYEHLSDDERESFYEVTIKFVYQFIERNPNSLAFWLKLPHRYLLDCLKRSYETFSQALNVLIEYSKTNSDYFMLIVRSISAETYPDIKSALILSERNCILDILVLRSHILATYQEISSDQLFRLLDLLLKYIKHDPTLLQTAIEKLPKLLADRVIRNFKNQNFFSFLNIIRSEKDFIRFLPYLEDRHYLRFKDIIRDLPIDEFIQKIADYLESPAYASLTIEVREKKLSALTKFIKEHYSREDWGKLFQPLPKPIQDMYIQDNYHRTSDLVLSIETPAQLSIALRFMDAIHFPVFTSKVLRRSDTEKQELAHELVRYLKSSAFTGIEDKNDKAKKQSAIINAILELVKNDNERLHIFKILPRSAAQEFSRYYNPIKDVKYSHELMPVLRQFDRDKYPKNIAEFKSKHGLLGDVYLGLVRAAKQDIPLLEAHYADLKSRKPKFKNIFTSAINALQPSECDDEILPLLFNREGFLEKKWYEYIESIAALNKILNLTNEDKRAFLIKQIDHKYLERLLKKRAHPINSLLKILFTLRTSDMHDVCSHMHLPDMIQSYLESYKPKERMLILIASLRTADNKKTLNIIKELGIELLRNNLYEFGEIILLANQVHPNDCLPFYRYLDTFLLSQIGISNRICQILQSLHPIYRIRFLTSLETYYLAGRVQSAVDFFDIVSLLPSHHQRRFLLFYDSKTLLEMMHGQADIFFKLLKMEDRETFLRRFSNNELRQLFENERVLAQFKSILSGHLYKDLILNRLGIAGLSEVIKNGSVESLPIDFDSDVRLFRDLPAEKISGTALYQRLFNLPVFDFLNAIGIDRAMILIEKAPEPPRVFLFMLSRIHDIAERNRLFEQIVNHSPERAATIINSAGILSYFTKTMLNEMQKNLLAKFKPEQLYQIFIKHNTVTDALKQIRLNTDGNDHLHHLRLLSCLANAYLYQLQNEVQPQGLLPFFQPKNTDTTIAGTELLIKMIENHINGSGELISINIDHSESIKNELHKGDLGSLFRQFMTLANLRKEDIRVNNANQISITRNLD